MKVLCVDIVESKEMVEQTIFLWGYYLEVRGKRVNVKSL